MAQKTLCVPVWFKHAPLYIGGDQPGVAKLHQRDQSSQSEADPLPAGWSKAALINSPELPTGTDTCFHPEISKEEVCGTKTLSPSTDQPEVRTGPLTQQRTPFLSVFRSTAHRCFFIDDASQPPTPTLTSKKSHDLLSRVSPLVAGQVFPLPNVAVIPRG